METDQAVTLSAFELRSDCYGFTYPVQQSASWSSSDSSVASVSGGQVTGISGGETTIRASWNSFSSVTTQCNPGPGFEPGPIEPAPCCNSLTSFRSASATVQVKPRITRIDPPRGLIGLEVPVNIVGTGFGNVKGNVTVQVGGTGVTPKVDAVTPREILATLTIAADAAPGNHAVTVKVRNQMSNSVNFFVQVPARIIRESMSDITTCDPSLCTINNEPNKCGAFRNLVYQVVDQAGNPIRNQGTVTEIITQWSNDAAVSTDPQATDENGRFADLVGIAGAGSNCPSNGSGFDFRQKFTGQFAGKTFNLTTIHRLQVQKSSGQYTITVTVTQQ
ncbi:MAG TPA: IPT/TIG domain-containing protein [Nitrososphaera sp.]|nr:IPT/TIG domain-containing protein [Nitrososphaera sp.]